MPLIDELWVIRLSDEASSFVTPRFGGFNVAREHHTQLDRLHHDNLGLNLAVWRCSPTGEE